MNLRSVCLFGIMFTMSAQRSKKMNWLATHLPEGLLVDAAWLRAHGYPSNLLAKYEASGWLTQPAHRVYKRPRGELSWQQVVISMQTLLGLDLVVGGRTALELHGLEHYLSQATTTVYLYGSKAPPTWLKNLGGATKFAHRKDTRLFARALASTAPHILDPPAESHASRSASLTTRPWGQWNWPLVLSTPERAYLELLDELPEHETFHQADMIMEGLTTLSPARLQQLLVDCHSLKVKRLFFFFADRHRHAWFKRLDRSKIDLGRGKRMLARGGRYDGKYMITVPRDLDADH
jgi:hypothetical protein